MKKKSNKKWEKRVLSGTHIQSVRLFCYQLEHYPCTTAVHVTIRNGVPGFHPSRQLGGFVTWVGLSLGWNEVLLAPNNIVDHQIHCWPAGRSGRGFQTKNNANNRPSTSRHHLSVSVDVKLWSLPSLLQLSFPCLALPCPAPYLAAGVALPVSCVFSGLVDYDDYFTWLVGIMTPRS